MTGEDAAIGDRDRPTHRWSGVQVPPSMYPTYRFGSQDQCFDEPDKWIGALSTVNVFAGPNNSGKSRLIRGLFRETSENSLPTTVSSSFPLAALVREARALVDETLSLAKAPLSFPVAVPEAAALRSELEAAARRLQFMILRDESAGWAKKAAERSGKVHRIIHRHARDSHEGWIEVSRRFTELLHRIVAEHSKKPEWEFLAAKLVYVPSLRFVRELSGAPTGVLEQTVMDQHFSGAAALGKEGDRSIDTGEGFYTRVRKMLLGSLAEREAIADFQRFVGDTFFEGAPIVLIPKEETRALVVKIGDEVERPIHHVGNGIQQLLILAFPIFAYADRDLLLFVDEPELALHPSLQRVFLNLCLDHPTNASRQVFLTTHSNHLLDLTLDRSKVSIYSTRKDLQPAQGSEVEPTFEVELVSQGDRSLLQALGARCSSVLTTNCTIWVEGITDRTYLRRYLELYLRGRKRGPTLREDFHYFIGEYGGSNLVHWSFFNDEGPDVRRITPEMFVVLDRDDSDKSVERAKALKRHLPSSQVRLLDCREIENLLTPDILLAAIRKLEPDDTVVNKHFEESDYALKPLGTFVDEIVLPKGSRRRSTSKKRTFIKYGNPNTMRDKPRFAALACGAMKSTEDMSQGALDLAKSVYKFICKANGLKAG